MRKRGRVKLVAALTTKGINTLARVRRVHVRMLDAGMGASLKQT